MRIALQLAYDGRDYAGWQIQPDRPTVQQLVERGLSTIADRSVRTVCAGRTDTGVHAFGQVVHFDTDVKRPDSAWVRGVNANLPDSIRVQQMWRVGPDFHARYHAVSRRYAYLLLCAKVRDPMWVGRAGWVHDELDSVAMAQAAQSLLGQHDFSSFRAAQCQANSPVRRIKAISLRRRGRWLLVELAADAFLHHMVRNIMGALVMVGRRQADAQWLADLLQARDRRAGPPTFPAEGLYFLGPDYGAESVVRVDVDQGWMP